MNGIIRAMALAAVVVLAAASPKARAEMEFPVKKSRSLTSDAEIRQIRDNIAKYPKAKAIADKIIKAADEWVARSDRYVWEFIPPSDIPRAFNSSFDGCPVHGMDYFKSGNYSWKMDPLNKPWKLVCPVGGEEYPTNDFMAYYKAKDRSLLTGDYPDDGWGWRKPGDKYKHWFVAYYCHWLWLRYIIPGVENLSKAYQITGDPKYARKAIVMLDRIADLYPSMDHNKQSRYAQEFAPSYTGKIVNLIWETDVIATLAGSYDAVFDVVSSDARFEGDGASSALNGKSNADIRRNIEENLLSEGIRSIYDGRIRGNYGTHQRSLSILAIVLQDDALSRRACDFILNNSEGTLDSEGFNYALDNLVLREGMAFESAPGYCLGWSYALAGVGESLDKLGTDIFGNAKFKRMFTAFMQLQVMGRFTPAIGDSGSVTSTGSDLSSSTARLALRKFKDPVFAKHLLDHGAYGENTLAQYDDLKYPVLDKALLEKAAKNAPDLSSGSRNLGGYGLGILEAGKDERAMGVAVYYGPTVGGHAHADKLFFELYGFDKKLIPDLGYPQFAAEYKGRSAWESNTLSHCTVTVNSSAQNNYATGRLNRFAAAPDVKLLDVSAPAVYAGVKEYRRTMLLIGGECESPYLVDLFTVEGGRSHDYSLHGFDGEFRTEGIDLVAQEQGTLAGEDVPFTYLFDDPDLEKPDKTRSYGSYTGSGYSYLYNVKRGIPTRSWSATWQAKDFGVRAIFPDQPLKEAVIADGNPPKRPGNPDSLKYVLLRRSGDECLSSRFACVFQPFKTGDQPLKVRRLPVESGVLLEIIGSHGTDLVYLADDGRMGERESGAKGERETGRKADGGAGRQGEPTGPSSPTSGGRNEGRGQSTSTVGGLSISGECAVLRTNPEHELKSVFLGGGGHIEQGMLSVESGPSLSGTLSTVNYKSNELELSPSLEQSANPQSANPQSEIRNPKSGTTILFGSANYPIHSARGQDGRLVISLGEDSPRIGKLAVASIDPEGKFVSTKTALHFANAGCYKDKWLVNEDFTVWHRIEDVSKGTVTLRDPADLKSEFTDKDGDGRITAYLYDVAPGQEFVIPATCWLGRDSSGKWSMESSSSAEASLPDGTRLGNG